MSNVYTKYSGSVAIAIFRNNDIVLGFCEFGVNRREDHICQAHLLRNNSVQ